MSPEDAERLYNKEWPAFNQRKIDAVKTGDHKKILAARRALSALSITYQDRHKKPSISASEDRQKIETLLNELGVEFSETESGSIKIEGGYCGFYTLFEFDSEDKFEEMGAYE